MENLLYGWLFTYNTYNQTWFAYYRDDSRAYWNGDDSNNRPIYKDKDHTKLIEKVKKGEKHKFI